MKRFYRFFAAAAIVATAAGCTPEDPDKGQQGETPKNDVLSAPELTATVGEGSISFSWTSGTIEGSELEVEYVLYVNKSGEDVFDGESFEVDGVSYTIDAEAFRTLLIEFGCQSGASIDLIAAVTATAGEENKTSGQESFSATLPELEIILPETLYLIGGACEGGWDTGTAIGKTAEEGVYEAGNVTLKFGVSEDGKGFKILTAEGVWHPFYGQDTAEGSTFGDIRIFATENDGDSQFYPLEHGYASGLYTVNINLNTMKVTLTKTGDVHEFIPQLNLYIMNNTFGWDFDEADALIPVADKVYEGQGFHLSHSEGFKFSAYNYSTEYIKDTNAGDNWTTTVRNDTTGDIYFELGPDDKDGIYTIRVDLNTMKVTLTLTEADPEIEPEEPTTPDVPATTQYPTTLYMAGGFNGWSLLVPMERIADGKFQVTDYEFNFDNGADDPKGHGFKFCETTDGWKDQWGPKENWENSEYRGWELAYDYDDTPQFYPQLAGFESGTYDVLVDFTTMTVTLTKK